MKPPLSYFGKSLLDGKKEYSARLLKMSPLFAMRVRAKSSSPAIVQMRLPVRVASWLLDSPRIGKTHSAKRFAGHLLKQPARQGVVAAQSRLGQLLCRDCCTPRDRRFGLELLRQAARAGDLQAQLVLGRHCCESGPLEAQQGRYWLEQAAAQGSDEALRLLGCLAVLS
ncbi:hypothetical protein SAMN04244572_04738 [Azotobacter beijerinckii]|uniref:Sel1 repeat-containing protein n=2 Tax=Azotobacter beijerinckii TaxID=170623 RepID=A0A1H7AP94_9GAMM|nr:hypothetical protein SAMN04244579_01084 [Azotobacter beijerinckii]SEJ63892.1 hypothetical protein SAMN04244572_04738 [Azotobacter beijerinckii]